MIFRDRAYTEMFGSFDDAKEIKIRADILNDFENDLVAGNITDVLKQTKENAPESFKKLIDNYLPQLAAVDKDAYFHIVGNIGKSIIKEMLKTNNDDVKNAAKILNKFLLDDTDDLEIKKLSTEKPTDNKLEEEKKQFNEERYNTVKNDLQTRVDNILRATIDSYIDPKNQMSAYVKKNAVKDALAEVHRLAGNDKDFRKNQDKLWQAVFTNKFAQSSVDSVKQAYLGKAKRLLKAVIHKTRAEALKDITPPKEEIDEDEETEEREEIKSPRKRIASGTPRQQDGKNNKSARRPGESMQEWFARD